MTAPPPDGVDCSVEAVERTADVLMSFCGHSAGKCDCTANRAAAMLRSLRARVTELEAHLEKCVLRLDVAGDALGRMNAFQGRQCWDLSAEIRASLPKDAARSAP